jgi:TATA-binding protein-associated factor
VFTEVYQFLFHLFSALIFCVHFQLLDLFSLGDKKKDGQKSSKSQPTPSHTLTMKTVLETLPDLWEDKQYEEEYDLTNFMKNLQN